MSATAKGRDVEHEPQRPGSRRIRHEARDGLSVAALSLGGLASGSRLAVWAAAAVAGMTRPTRSGTSR